MTTRRRQRVAVLLAASLSALAVAAASASAAESSAALAAHTRITSGHTAVAAGTATATRRVVIASGTAVATGALGARAGAVPAAGTVITCETFVDLPLVVFAGTLFVGQEKPYNAVGAETHTTCDGKVQQITMTSEMQYNGGAITFGPTSVTFNAFAVTGAVLTFCAPGDFQAAATSNIIMPTGFKPPTLQLADTGGLFTFTEQDCNGGLIG